MKHGGNSLKQSVYEALNFLLSIDLENKLTFGGMKMKNLDLIVLNLMLLLLVGTKLDKKT